MGYTRLKRKKIQRATKKKWRGGAMITKTKAVQQSFDTIHDFYKFDRGLFGLVLETDVAKLEAKLAEVRAKKLAGTAEDSDVTKAETLLQQGRENEPFIPLYRAMRSIMQYMIITLNSITFHIDITPPPDIHKLTIDANTNFGKYVGYNKPGQLFFTGDGKTPTSPKSGVSISGIEISGRDYFEIPEGRQWPYSLSGPNAESSFINLVNVLFNINNDPDDDIKHAYNLALGLDKNTPIPAAATLTNRHRIYMVCDAGASTYGTLAASVRPLKLGGKPAKAGKPAEKLFDKDYTKLTGPPLTELYLPLSTADSASSNPYEDHEFVFVASPATPTQPYNPDVFISDANLYTSGIYEIRYERHKWHPATGLGFRLVIIRKNPKEELFALEYGVLGATQSPFVKATVNSKDPPYIYNGQGPSAALLSGCILLRTLNSVPQVSPANTYIQGVAAGGDVKPAYKDIPEEKLNDTHGRIRAKVTDQTRKEIVTKLTELMKPANGFSPLSSTAKMVDPYNLLGNRFGEFPPELWFDIKRGGDRDQVKALHILSKQRDASDNLVYPFIHFVTGDLLAAKMAVELGLAVIYLAGTVIRYWPKMFRFRPASRGLPSPHGITTTPAPDAANGPWAIAQWGGKKMKGGLRNPISKDIGMPPYTHIENYEGRQYTYHDLDRMNIPKIILHGLWLHPSEYVYASLQQLPQLNLSVSQKIHLDGIILQFFISLLQDQQFQQQIQQNTYFQQDPQGKHRELLQQLLQFQQQITQLQQQQQEQQQLHYQLGQQILPLILHILLGINYTTLDSSRVQPMFNALQQLQLLASDNSGIYQYDFLNTLLFNNSTEINKLDELTFRSVNNSKEDDGLEGAALIGENSPAVEVRSDDGTLLWTIPALLDEHLLNYDITFMVKQFLRSVVLYCNDQGFTKEEIGMFMTGRVWIGQNFMTTYGINPIVSYIKAKYRDFDDRVINKAYEDVRVTMGSLIEETIKEFPRVSDAQSSAAASSVSTPIRSFITQPSAAASSVLPPIGFSQSTFSSNPPPASRPRPPPPPASNRNRIRISSQPSPSPQSAFGQPYFSTSLSSTPFAGFAQSSSSSPQQSAFGQSPFSTSLGPTPSAAFAQPSSSSSGQATAPLILKLTRKASKNLPGQRTIKKGINAEKARRDRENLQQYLRKQQRQATVNSRRQGAIPGGRRRTQKNHKRKRHGTQRKRSHKGSKSTSQ
jgi:hypothetical protein